MGHAPGPILDTCLHVQSTFLPCKISLSWLFKSLVLIILTMFLLSVYYCPILQMENEGVKSLKASLGAELVNKNRKRPLCPDFQLAALFTNKVDKARGKKGYSFGFSAPGKRCAVQYSRQLSAGNGPRWFRESAKNRSHDKTVPTQPIFIKMYHFLD